MEFYKDEFPGWVNDQGLPESIFACDTDIRIDRPFPEDERIWSLWAHQNCKEFDMILTVFLDEPAYANMRGYIGAEETERGCSRVEYLGPEITQCEFELKARGSKFGMLFSGGFMPIFYEVDWKLAETYVPVFNWW